MVLRSAYRREPVSSFLLTVGIVDTVIGGVGLRPSLFGFGLVVACLALYIRWAQSQDRVLQPSKFRSGRRSRQRSNYHFPVPTHRSQQPLPRLMPKHYR